MLVVLAVRRTAVRPYILARCVTLRKEVSIAAVRFTNLQFAKLTNLAVRVWKVLHSAAMALKRAGFTRSRVGVSENVAPPASYLVREGFSLGAGLRFLPFRM